MPIEGSASPPPKVFISYSHDSREHQDSVLILADRLRQDGIDALVDQYNPAPREGWPMWMDSEIQKADFVLLVCTDVYLRRVERREEPGKGRGVLWETKIIYNHLYVTESPVQKFIPVLLDGGDPAHIPTPLRTLTYYSVTSDGSYEDLYRHITGQPRHRLPKLGKLKPLAPSEPQSYPASLEFRPQSTSPTRLDQRNRLAVLKRVRQDWIHDVLNKSLYKLARIELGLEAKEDAPDHPLNAIVQVPDRSPTDVPPGTPVTKLFDDHGEALLILGAPGTGKTTLLLELAQGLLDRAARDQNYPVPVVFNLSSWALRRQPLSTWLVTELNDRSDVPEKLAQRWVDSEQILPLLDGLDEVAENHRAECVEAINQFRRNHGLLPIAVCSRTSDYEALGIRLRLRNSVVVQPLNRDQVQDYLARAGDVMMPLCKAVREDSSLAELLETPLMLWVAMLAYRASPEQSDTQASVEERRKRLFASFVDAMLKRRSVEARYEPAQTVHWLSWLAFTLTARKETVFYLESLHLDWLPSQTRRRLSNSASLLNALLTGPWMRGCLAVVPPWKIRLVEIHRVRFSHILFAVVAGTGLALMSWLVSELLIGRLFGLRDALLFGLVGGLILGFSSLPTYVAVEASKDPNRGTRNSIESALVALLVVGLTSALLLGSKDGMVAGLVFGLLAGLFCGGLFAVRHLVVRLALWMKGSAPLKYIPFLDYAAERVVLRKVGGGYIFVHRMLLEYFASLQKPEI